MPEAKVFFEYEGTKIEMEAPTFLQLWTSCKYFIYPWRRELSTIVKVFGWRKFETAIDVGACIGIYPVFLTLLNPNMKIYALEPASVNYRYLLRNTIHLPNVHCLKMAASSETKQVTIAAPTREQKEFMNNRAVPTNTGIISVYGESDLYREKADAIRLDGLVSRCDFIKIDAEGHDLEVIKGAKRLFETARPLMLVEFHKHNMEMAGVTTQDLVDLCNEIDYTVVYRWRQDLIIVPIEKVKDYDLADLVAETDGIQKVKGAENAIRGGDWL